MMREIQNIDLWVTPNITDWKERKLPLELVWSDETSSPLETGTGELSAAPHEVWEQSCYWKPCCHFHKLIFSNLNKLQCPEPGRTQNSTQQVESACL